jgi:hypothetical protein
VVAGSHFVRTSVVRWNARDRGTMFVSAIELRATISAADVANVGTDSVSVFSPSPGGGTSNVVLLAVGTPRVAAIELQAPPAPLGVGQSVRLTMTLRGGAGQDLSASGRGCLVWASSDPSVVTVDTSGTVTGALGGQADVTAVCDGVRATATVRVNNPVPSVTGLSHVTVSPGSGAFTLAVTGTGS